MGPHRRRPLPGVRRRGHPPDAAADRRPGPRAARRHPLPGAGAGGAGPQGHLRARCSPTSPPRASPGPGSTASSSRSAPASKVELARYEQHTIEVVVDRLVRRDGIERRLTDSLETALRSPRAWPRSRSSPATARSSTTPRPSPSPSTSPARTATAASRSWPRATSRSTRPTAPASGATASAPATRSSPELVVPDPDVVDRRRRHRPVGQRPRLLLPAAGRRACARSRASPPTSRGRALPAKQQKLLLHGTGSKKDRVLVKYKNRYGRTRTYHANYEGVIPYLQRRHSEAESDTMREQIEGWMREVPCPALRRRPAQAALARRHDQRPQHRRGLRHVDRRVGGVLRRPRAVRARPHDRRAGAEGGARPHRVPARRRARLPQPLPHRRHPRRRRGPAHPAGVADRLGPRRRALRARRAVDRPAPARQPPAHRDDDPHARPRQHGDRRRARRGHDQGRRPRRRHRPRRRRARRRGRLLRHLSRGC